MKFFSMIGCVTSNC